MKLKSLLLISGLLFLLSEVQAETIHQWDVLTIKLTSRKIYTNPYKDIPVTKVGDLLTATFWGTGGNALNLEITVVGFWNGGSEWHINFTPPVTGRWNYSTTSADRSMNGKKGQFEVLAWNEEEKSVNPVRHGFIRVKKDGEIAGHFFEYSDGQPVLWIGDTWWNWTDSRIHFETFKQLVDNRSAKGFNIGQLFVPGNGWGRESSLLDETYSVLDTSHLRRVEDMIRYANSKGITVWIHGWWSRPNLNTTIGAEKIQRWWRYLVHRFGAYNVIWVLAGEYNMNNYGGFGIDFWKDLGKLVKNEDPYERILSVHNTPPFWDGGAEAPQWSTGKVLHQESWLDYNQSQVGHGKFANEMIPIVISEEYSLRPAKPIVITEPWYEFIEGNPTGMDIRFAAWSAILSGAAGHTYGGGHVWLASVSESPADERTWPIEKGFTRTTYDYEGAVSMKHLADFFKNVRWWNMAPHPEIVKEYPQPFCLAKPGEEYVIYLRYGGTVNIQMDGDASAKNYRYYWYNPATGKEYDSKSIHGKNILQFNCPDGYPGIQDYKDWVLYICKD
jgi:Protein of unknown function (DUF4038)/Domain of unknown function (DUF5060)/Putative collagen-binding domain of a collagenase